jgi:PAS domain S-box-containing protein
MNIKYLIDLKENDPGQRNRELMTRAVLLIVEAVVIVFLFISSGAYFVGLIPGDTPLIFSTIAFLNGIAILMAGGGLWRQAGYILPLIIYIFAVYGNYMGGVDAPAILMYAVSFTLIAILQGFNRMWFFLIISLGAYLTLAVMFYTGYLAPQRTTDTAFLNRVIVASGSLAGMAMLTWLIGLSYRREISMRLDVEIQLRGKNEELSAVNEELHATLEELEATNEEFEAMNNELLDAQKDLLDTNEKLTVSENKFYQIFFSSPVPMSLNLLETGEYIDVNEAIVTQSGFSRDEMIGSTSVALGIYTKTQMAHIYRVLKRKGYINNHEVRIKIKSGEERLTLFNAYVARLDMGETVITSTLDITDKRASEEIIVRNQKLESLGLIAGGLAHDFNNILMGILGNLSMAGAIIGKESQAITYIKNSSEACERARGLTRQLLTFSKGGLPLKKRVNTAQLFTSSVLFNLAGSRVKAEFKIGDDLSDIEADEGQLSQVINNLVLNSIQSMADGGTLNVTLAEIEIDGNNPPLLLTGTPVPGKYLFFTIEDRGEGIKPEHLSRIFDPYFTTKQGGTGLGLAVVYSIVTGHGGYIDIHSNPGEGSIFKIYLPAAPPGTAASVSQSSQADEAPVPVVNEAAAGRRSLNVLVMDDEKQILAVVKSMLKHTGHTADTAENGSDAVKLYRSALESSRPYDMVIMDLTIPGGMGGRETIGILRELDPSVRAIVSSGYSDDPIFVDPAAHGFKSMLRKPFTLEVLTRALDEAMV